MSGWVSSLWGGKEVREAQTRKKNSEAVATLRQTLSMLDKKEKHFEDQIAKATQRARENAGNKAVALQALRHKKTLEADLARISNQRSNIETQMNALESATSNRATLDAMKQGADALRNIHKGLDVEEVDKTMDRIREGMEVTNEVSEAISMPIGMNADYSEADLEAELDEIQQDELDKRLVGAPNVPVTNLPTPQKATVGRQPTKTQAEADEEEELRQLQAELAM